MRQIDEAGIALIKSFENFSAVPYQDQIGVWTIGYGHTDGVTSFTPLITKDQADGFLRDDLEPIEKAINDLVKVELTQNEFNALSSFIFNNGIRNFKNSSLLDKLNAGDRRGAAKEFDRWVYVHDPKTGKPFASHGLIERRKKEKDLFLSDFENARALAQSVVEV